MLLDILIIVLSISSNTHCYVGFQVWLKATLYSLGGPFCLYLKVFIPTTSKGALCAEVKTDMFPIILTAESCSEANKPNWK